MAAPPHLITIVFPWNFWRDGRDSKDIYLGLSWINYIIGLLMSSEREDLMHDARPNVVLFIGWAPMKVKGILGLRFGYLKDLWETGGGINGVLVANFLSSNNYKLCTMKSLQKKVS